MAKKKVLLIRPLGSSEKAESTTFEHLGLGYLAAYLESHGIESEICDTAVCLQVAGEVVARASSNDYALVGITVPSPACIDEALDLGKRIKQAQPKVHLCLGGHFPTAAHDLILSDFLYVDSVVRGEGERPLLELASSLIEGSSLCSIRGLTYRDNGQILSRAPAEPLTNIDALPFPKRYAQARERGGIRYAAMVASRGCQFRCPYCSINNFYDGAGWRGRSIPNILEEMTELYREQDCTGFDFSDDNFVPSGRRGDMRVKEFCDALRGSELRDLTLGLMITPTSVTNSIVRQLYEVGLRSVLVGVESASPASLKRLHKATSPGTNARALSILRNYDIAITAGWIMFDHPDTSLSDIGTNIRFLKQYANRDNIIYEPLSRLEVYYGTPVYHELLARGQLTGTYIDPQYNFADTKVAWLYDVSTKLMQQRLGQISEWARGLSKESATVSPAHRQRRWHQSLNLVLDILAQLADFSETTSRLPSVEESVARFEEAVNYGFNYLLPVGTNRDG